jgi:hypothetical protein
MMILEILLALTSLSAAHAATGEPIQKENVVVYRESGRFGGWPANNGIWSWGDEILVGFSLGYFKPNDHGHAIDPQKPTVRRFARSLDGGRTWKLEVPSFVNDEGKEKEPVDPPGGIEFTHPNFGMTLRMVSSRGGFSWFYYSYDRGRTWKGPYKLPTFDQKGIAARTDYIVNGKHDCMAFLTASKPNGKEGRVFCSRTTDGGKTWKFVSWIGPEPEGFSIMPSSVRLSPTRILTAIRRKEGDAHWIDGYVTDDNGSSWRFLNKSALSTGGSVGNPPRMIKLKDGRIAITYGYRSAPYGIRARISDDGGVTWGEEIMLRTDGGWWDLGYPRTVQRPDGYLVTTYYFNDHKETERYIAATIWKPSEGHAR